MEPAGGRTWEHRLVHGLRAMPAPTETRDALINALGALGCEAEFGLKLLQISALPPAPTHRQGEHWLRQCFGLCQRVKQASADLSLAAYMLLAALTEREESVAEPLPDHFGHVPVDSWSAQFDAAPDVWWPERATSVTSGDTSELWLCRAGFGYRHAVTVGLPGHLDALEEGLALTLHALRTLPPVGVLAWTSLYLGVHTLATELASDLIPHHIDDIDQRHVGLLTGIPTLFRLYATEGKGIANDLLWAHGELDRARATLAGPAAAPNPHVTRSLLRPTGNLWARQIVTDWERTVAQLEAIHAAQMATTSVL